MSWYHHGHVITLTHLKDGMAQFVCQCGEEFMGREGVVKARMMAHRMEVFPRVRYRLTGGY